jgi:HD-GYP domain-containing protein (c-di-GMP phosphodiesterase class II)/DNA-binding CsgD family transcriptional regulator
MSNGPVRLVELLGALSLACDAADGFAHETTMRTAVLAGALARRGGDDAFVADVVVGALLRHIGCTGFAVEEAHRYAAGDDVGLRAVMAEVDFARPELAMGTIHERLAAHAPAPLRTAAVEALLTDGPTAVARHDAAQCDAAERLTSLLPVSPGAARVASHAFERWDGNGGPDHLAGDEISRVARVVEVAYVAELFRSRQGRGGAAAELRARRGGHLDPGVVDDLLGAATELFDLLDDPQRSCWDLLGDAEPAPHARVSPAQVDQVALAFARFTDLKSTWFSGHSEHVAELAAAAATSMGIHDDTCRALRRAGLLHDIGRVGVPTGIWDLPRTLSPHEHDRVRFHSWETERILHTTPLFGTTARIAAAAHERHDGSGYHRGHVPDEHRTEAALLAAADMWCALTAPRPHRDALDTAQASEVLHAAVRDGRLPREPVDAVLGVVGQPPVVGRSWPVGLTDREVDVLRLIARGSSDRQISADLGITTKTVAHHVQHVYDKIGVRSRAGATLFALDHRLTT